jgi:hypothetical protein
MSIDSSTGHSITPSCCYGMSQDATIFGLDAKSAFIDGPKVVSKQVGITSMRILTLEKYRGRNPRGYFQDLPRQTQYEAYWWLDRFVKRWRGDMPPWRFAILVGQARRLALNPPTSAWGRSMHAKRGGLAVQRQYWLDGRNPTERATQVRLAKQRRKKAVDQPPDSRPCRVMHLPLWD